MKSLILLGPLAVAGGYWTGLLGQASGLQAPQAASQISLLSPAPTTTPTPTPTYSAPHTSKPEPTRLVYLPRIVVQAPPPVVIVVPSPTTSAAPTTTPSETPSPTATATPSASATPTSSLHLLPS